jgi:hypothetical protein
MKTTKKWLLKWLSKKLIKCCPTHLTMSIDNLVGARFIYVSASIEMGLCSATKDTVVKKAKITQKLLVMVSSVLVMMTVWNYKDL